jgi:hypothetical protein
MAYIRRMKEWLQIKRFQLKEQIGVMRKYYKSPRFLWLDLLFGLSAFFLNPYRLSRKFMESKGEREVHTYGETPLQMLESLLKEAGATSKDRYVELGSGRGRSSLWVSHFLRCQVRGVEWIPTFVFLAKTISFLSGVKGKFECKSLFESNLKEATLVYLYATHFSEENILNTLKTMPLNSTLITISEPPETPFFKVEKKIDVRFPWGETQAFLSRKVI